MFSCRTSSCSFLLLFFKEMGLASQCLYVCFLFLFYCYVIVVPKASLTKANMQNTETLFEKKDLSVVASHVARIHMLLLSSALLPWQRRHCCSWTESLSTIDRL
ncbi:hypothetical protein BDB00DRAFT_473712 [Zychaea mexicana]|uniref:uncharacterized protein n=1 Tax=Zychaea mexicana TaxID=64656 RepID=UPI0022FE6E61|nr:uncharacterized protein BDB00DRAFT_473712 [Zychaea mexicana]KAI9491819.1 hypothetical protein BDB00DRAFT_473712 [Zychaea mexicana]